MRSRAARWSTIAAALILVLILAWQLYLAYPGVASGAPALVFRPPASTGGEHGFWALIAGGCSDEVEAPPPAEVGSDPLCEGLVPRLEAADLVGPVRSPGRRAVPHGYPGRIPQRPGHHRKRGGELLHRSFAGPAGHGPLHEVIELAEGPARWAIPVFCLGEFSTLRL